ncbi:MAG: ATP-dependent helicase HrpB [Motiliproteus sp.]|jgi:ATP-dependent helicase HrpB
MPKPSILNLSMPKPSILDLSIPKTAAPNTLTSLPIDALLPELCQALRLHTRCVLQASPGAGKTTRVPQALLEQPWLRGQKILMLEPRRIAARSAAGFMAHERGEQPGATIGYRSRLDTRVGPNTRIEVVTEGILTRMLQSDPALEGIGCVIFDEFHERNLQADLGLALLLQSQQLLRDELRILIMSATLEPLPLLGLLGQDCPIISSAGRSFPVQTHYLDGSPSPFDPERIARAIEQALQDDDGSLLCFLPGSGEIHRTLQALKKRFWPGTLLSTLELIPLYGGLSAQQQDLAIAPSAAGQRKVVLATSIAETSLTIDGISTVIDCGLMRLPRFDPRSGMTRLETQVVSAASADQRRGRAGRLRPGRCFRLWSESHPLSAQSPAEILHADLAPLVLELAHWGCSANELSWLDPPPPIHLQQARELLLQLGALDASGALTASGKQLSQLGTHPRLGTMMLHAKRLGLGWLGCQIAALLSERDPLSSRDQGADLQVRLLQLQHGRKEPQLQRIRESARRWSRQLHTDASDPSDAKNSADSAGLLLAFAFPDRIGQRRGDQPSSSNNSNNSTGSSNSRQYLLRNGKGAEFRDYDRLCEAPYLVCAELDGHARSARIYLAAAVELEQLQQQFAAQLVHRDQVGWDTSTQSVRGHRECWLGKLRLQHRPISELTGQQCIDGLLDGIRQLGLDCLPWNETHRSRQQRVELMRRLNTRQSWPDLSDSTLLATLEQWLAPYLSGIKRLAQLKRLNLSDILQSRLSWEQQQQLERQLPPCIRVPSGSNIRIDYSNPEQPVLAVRLQELFGLQQSPALIDGKLPLTLQLLSPAQRPIQITQDLASFWDTTYPQVCKDLKGRYPKHYWPDNPREAAATSGTKKAMLRQQKD